MKTETKHTHTQGPWRAHVAHADLRTHADIVCTESGLHVCDVASYDESPDKRNANARLIAAAPDLLAALQSLVFHTSHFIHGDGKDGAIVANELRNAVFAIHKAEGNA